MASQWPRDILPRAVPPPPFRRDPVRDALCRLGLTEEQFKAKQTEMMEVLLRNEPFVPKEAPPPNRAHSKPSLNFYEKMTAGSSRHGSRGRSSSVSSSSSSRGPSPTPRTPTRKDNGDAGQPRPRDQMELVIEQRNRVKEGKRRESTSRPREETRVPSTPTRDTARQAPTNYPPETPHHYRYYSERVIGEASSSRRSAVRDLTSRLL
ncbi:hypothetical protein C8Q79DRAFT_984372 [Trametes meyenii]|nr:hypothetical protein C8Q79DRAFT_984372 [Trametes meyenii]